MRRLRAQGPNISPLQELMGEQFGKLGEVWQQFKKIDFKFFIGYLLLLYTLPQFLSWMTSWFTNTSNPSNAVFATGIVKLLALLAACLLPSHHYQPLEVLYKKRSSPEYSYVEQLFSYVSHSVVHMFIMEVLPSDANFLLILLTGIFWCAWSHYRLQGSCRKKLSVEDGNIYWLTWGICALEALFVVREIGGTLWISSAVSVTRAFSVVRAIMDAAAMIAYGVGIAWTTKKLVWHHMRPLVGIVCLHFLIQVLVVCSNSVEQLLLHLNGGMRGKLLPSGMLAMVFLNSLLRDIKLSNENQATAKRAGQKESAAVVSVANSLITAGMIMGSLIFYYSQQNIWYLALQYCILLWNLADLLEYANTSHSGIATIIRGT